MGSVKSPHAKSANLKDSGRRSHKRGSDSLGKRLRRDFLLLTRHRLGEGNTADDKRAAEIVTAALLNPLYVPWDIKVYANKVTKGLSTPESIAKMLRNFPNPMLGQVNKPATVVDSQGQLMAWYLPGLLTNHQSRLMLGASENVQAIGSQKIHSKKHSKKGVKVNWRVDKKNFRFDSPNQHLSPGSDEYSAGWFAQGHTAPNHPLKPSANINNRGKGTGNWMSSIAHIESFLNRTFFMVHPSLAQHGKVALDRLRQAPMTSDIADSWTSYFTGIAVIINRKTLAHRDGNGLPPWYDLLLGIGDYHSCTLDMPDLGLQLDYGPGTGIFLCGNTIRHAVTDWSGGDRVCYAHFMRKKVLQRLDVGMAGWSTQQDFARIIPEEKRQELGFLGMN